MSSIVVILCSVLAMMVDAMPETCAQGETCRAPLVEGFSLLQYRMDQGQAPEKAAADAPKEAADAPKEEAKAEAKEAAKEEAKDAGAADAAPADAAPADTVTDVPAVTEEAAANVTANVTNATNETTPAPATGCVTKNDPRASAWFAETSPDGTPCVFAADVRDEGSHCILSEGEYGTNGWCWTSIEQSSWGSCGDNCPLYGPAAKLGAKLDGVAKVVTDIHGMLNGSGTASANEAGANEAAPTEEPKTAPKGDVKAEEGAKNEEAPAGDAKAAEADAKKESALSQMKKAAPTAGKKGSAQMKAAAPADAKKESVLSQMQKAADQTAAPERAMKAAQDAVNAAEKAAQNAVSLVKAAEMMKASAHTQVKQDPATAADAKKEAPADAKAAPAADAKAPAADAKTAPAADAKAEPAADANAAPANDAKAEPAAEAIPTEAPADVNASIAANVTNVSNATPAEEPVSGCQTKEDPRAAAWFTATAPAGTPCVFGVDVRDEGGHCIYSGGEYGSNGWCFTSKDQSAWGSCNDQCPLYGAHKKLGDKIEAVTDMVAKVSTHLESSMNGTAPTTETAEVTGAPAESAALAAMVKAPAAEAKAPAKTVAEGAEAPPAGKAHKAA